MLDTNVALLLPRQDLGKQQSKLASIFVDPAVFASVSIASLWEIAIKTRLGKLDPGMPLEDVAGLLTQLGRLLLAQCQIEGLKLVTLDRALLAIAW